MNRRIQWLLCVAALMGAAALPVHALTHQEKVVSVRQMVDSARTIDELDKAAGLLQEVLAADPNSVEGNVQATRIVMKRAGGDPGAMAVAEQFIDKAIAATPNGHAPALSLKGEILLLRGDLPQAKQVLDRARAADERNPWVRLNLARYYESMGQGREADAEFTQVFRWGPQGSPDQVRAYPRGLVGMAWYLAVPQQANIEELRRLARLSDEVRKPNAAYPLPDFARMFFSVGALDDALALSRKAVAADDEDSLAQQALASVLYARAAQMVMNKQDPAALVREARTLRYHTGGLACSFTRAEKSVQALLPVVVKLLPVRPEVHQNLLVAQGCVAVRQG